MWAAIWLTAAVLTGSGAAAEDWSEDQEQEESGFDLSRLDDDGLYGAADALRALDYEFCIPDAPRFRVEVGAIDPSARFLDKSPGRIGCGPAKVLVLGNTHQPAYREILSRLGALPYVDRIIPAWFE